MDSKEELTPAHIMQIGIGFWASKVLLSAVEIGVFTELAKGPEEFNILAGRMGLHMRSARDFLDALVALGFLQRSTRPIPTHPRPIFFSTAASLAIQADPGDGERAALRILESSDGSAAHGPATERGQGGQWSIALTAMYADPARLKGFLAAMSGISHGANIAIACKAPWANYKSYADVGTAQGDLAVQIALRDPFKRNRVRPG